MRFLKIYLLFYLQVVKTIFQIAEVHLSIYMIVLVLKNYSREIIYFFFFVISHLTKFLKRLRFSFSLIKQARYSKVAFFTKFNLK